MFWSRYVALCDKMGKAPNVVAAEVGVKSSGTVTGWKNGARPRDSVLQKLSQYFGCSVEDLIGEQKETPPTKKADGAEEELIRLFRLLPDDLKAGILAQIKAVLAQRGLLPSQSE